MSYPAIWQFGNFRLDGAERQLRQDGSIVPLPPKAFDILLLLVRNAGRLVKRQELFDSVWGSVKVEDANLTNNVTVLRRVLGREAIAAVPKFGYRFCLPISTAAELSDGALRLLHQVEALMARRSTECVLRARDLLWLIIAQEPPSALVWAWLGRACRFLEKFGVEREYHRSLVDSSFARAFALDPELSSAHRFFTIVQVDRGEALPALLRLLRLAGDHGLDAPSFAALVQVCRFCGLADASVAAHHRAVELDASIETSVPHTYFARCQYEAVLKSYLAIAQSRGCYLDVCAWACLGSLKHAHADAKQRLESRQWPPLFESLLKSLLSALENRPEEVRRICLEQQVYEDPETNLYFARNLAFSGCHSEALSFLGTAINGGLAVPEMLESDPWFAGLRPFAEFDRLLKQTRRMQSDAERTLRLSNASHFLYDAAQ